MLRLLTAIGCLLSGALVSVVSVLLALARRVVVLRRALRVALAAISGPFKVECWRPSRRPKILWGLFEGVSFKIGSTQSLLKVP